MYVRTGGLSGVRRGLGDLPTTCYYYVQDSSGNPVCGTIGGQPAYLPASSGNPDLAQITLNEVDGYVRDYATQAANLLGALPMYAGRQNKAADCASAYFQKLVNLADVMASDSAARLNAAANQALRYVFSGNCGSWTPPYWVPIPVIASQLQQGRYSPIQWCDDRTPVGASACQALQTIAGGGSFDFVSLLAGSGGAPAPLRSVPFPAPVTMPPVTPNQTILPPPPVSPTAAAAAAAAAAGQLVDTSIWYVAPGSAAPPADGTVKSGSIIPGPVPPVPTNNLQVPGGAQYINPAMNQTYYPQSTGVAPAAAGSSVTSSAAGMMGSLTSWVSSNPLEAAAIAAVAALFLFGGKR